MICNPHHALAAAGGVVCDPERPGASGTPSSRPERAAPGSGEWVTEPGRPGAHTTPPAAARAPGRNQCKSWGASGCFTRF
jgi:hypothetical protein